MKTLLKIHLALFLVASPSLSLAESSGMGTDMWTRTFDQWGLFTPHENYCDSGSEVFVAISGTASRGFCIEKDERTAAAWEAARDDCASDKKRLPEPAEWKFSCVNANGLNNMTDDWEWASNFPITISSYAGTWSGGVVIPKLGSGSCARASWDHLAYSSEPEGVFVYRCVR